MLYRTTLVCILALTSIAVSAQSPHAVSYQTLVRDNSGEVVTNSAISLRFDLHQNTAGGTVVFSESHSVSTNEFGLVNILLGQGSPISGALASVDWSQGPYFLETLLDLAGGSSFTSMGTDQLISVPYALHAESASQVDDADANPSNELNTTLSLSGTTLSLTDAGGTLSANLSSLQDGTGTDDQILTLTGSTLSIEDGNDVNLGSLNTDDQILTLTGSTLSIEDGNDVNLGSLNTDDQTLTLTGSTLSIEDGNDINLSSIDTDTDDQTLTLTGSTLSIEDGNSVDLSSIDTDTDDQTLSLTGNTLSIADGNSVSLAAYANQQLDYLGGTLSISNGNSVNLSDLSDGTGTDDQTLSLSGNNLSIEDGNTVDLTSILGDDDWTVDGTKLYSPSSLTHVGIGTANPGHLSGSSKYLTIGPAGTYAPGSATSLELIGNVNSGNKVTTKIDFFNPSFNVGNTARIEIRSSSTRVDHGNMLFYTRNDTIEERMRITKEGRVGIGTTNPSNLLHLKGSTSAYTRYEHGGTYTWTVGSNNVDSEAFQINRNTSSGSATYFRIGTDGTTNLGHGGNNVFVNYHTTIGQANFVVGSPHTSGYGGMQVNINAGASAKPFYGYAIHGAVRAWTYFDEADDYWKVNNSGTRLVVGNNGRVGVNKSAPETTFHVGHSIGSSNGLSIENISTNRRWHFYVYSTGDLSIRYNDTQKGTWDDVTGNYTVGSDRRLKSNITDLGHILPKVLQLAPKSYSFKEHEDAGKYIGFIAQDVQKVFPSLVHHQEDDDAFFMDYSGLGPIAIKAIQEQQAEIKDLKKRIEQLESLMTSPENK